jgi:hypothetical protein
MTYRYLRQPSFIWIHNPNTSEPGDVQKEVLVLVYIIPSSSYCDVILQTLKHNHQTRPRFMQTNE